MWDRNFLNRKLLYFDIEFWCETDIFVADASYAGADRAVLPLCSFVQFSSININAKRCTTKYSFVQ